MSDEPVRAPFANPLPPQPESEEDKEARLQAERDEAARQAEEAANAPPVEPQPLTDEKTYPTPPTADPKVTHATMSTEQLEELGYDQDGGTGGEPEAVEEKQQSYPSQEPDEE